MSISQLFTKNEYKVECKELKTDSLTILGDLTTQNLTVVNEVKGGLDIEGKCTADSFQPNVLYDASVVMGGCFAGQSVQLQFVNYGEFTFMDIGEFLNKTPIPSADGSALFPVGTIPLAFRPTKNSSFPLIVQRGGNTYTGAIFINTDGSMVVVCTGYDGLVQTIGGIQQGGNLIRVRWEPPLANNCGWYNQSITYWRQQLQVSNDRPPVPEPTPIPSPPI